MAHRRESSVALLKYDHGHWHHAGQEEGSEAPATGASRVETQTAAKFFWTVASVIALCGMAAALTLSAMTFIKLEKHSKHQIDAVCNRGSNADLDLPLCPDTADVPGFALLSGNP